MAGPNSSPIGDKSLTTNDKVWCTKHNFKLELCDEDCTQLRKRDMLARQHKLITGKTK